MQEVPIAPGYFIDVNGDVFSRWTTQGRVGVEERRLKLAKDKDGYLRVCLAVNRRQRYFRVNRLVALTYHGDAPSPRHVARHLNGIVTDNRPCNIAWGTQAENKADEVFHGTKLQGERAPWAKMSDALAAEIKQMLVNGMGVTSVSAATGVPVVTVSQIKGNRQWKHVPWPGGIVPASKPYRSVAPETVAAVRALLNDGSLQKKQIAKKFGLSETVVRGIGTGRYYRSVPPVSSRKDHPHEELHQVG